MGETLSWGEVGGCEEGGVNGLHLARIGLELELEMSNVQQNKCKRIFSRQNVLVLITL